ncbi:MAG: glycoside hydrolase family 130 protein [Actinomycetota bacterium]|nr:glycoside hydrolase family 130 protein [Actinomycetota bacterium]
MSVSTHPFDTGVELTPDPRRVVVRFFVPGREDVGPGDSRAGAVLDRILALDEAVVVATVADIDERFLHRHPDLHATFAHHADLVASRITDGVALSPARRLLLGASFTHEYAIEAAALCNPSAVVHPLQGPGDDVAFVLSVRCIGEGHRSSIGFRTGRLTGAGTVTLDEPGPCPQTTTPTPGQNHTTVFHAKLADRLDDFENAALVLNPLPALFSDAALEEGISSLAADRATRRNTHDTIENLRAIARSSYELHFPAHTALSERVLWPHIVQESHGMEDARFVRFTDDDGTIAYYATYTAFDGVNISQQLLETTDFVGFTSSPLAGEAAVGKGLALFPRKIRGQYVALTRSDRETNSIAFSDDVRCWANAETIQVPKEPWEILQLGNCGPPIETERGWLVLTHGVGPMRTYSLGAILLDLDHPQRVVARATTPLVMPDELHRDGYVPNVVYSCGGFAHHDTLVLPYGRADQSIAIATFSIAGILGSMTDEPPAG